MFPVLRCGCFLLLVLGEALGGCATENPQNFRAAKDPPAVATVPPNPTIPASPTAGPATSIAVAPAGLTVLAGASPVPFSAQGKDDGGRDGPLPAGVNWTLTSGSGTGSIDNQGRFTPGNPGDLTVTATSGSLTTSVPVTVVTTRFSSLSIVLPSASPTPTPTPQASPTIGPSPGVTPSPTPVPAALMVVSGTSITLSARGTRDGTTGPVTPTWSVNPGGNALLDGLGNFRAFLPGTVTVSASVPDATAQTTIAITPGTPQALVISGATGTLSLNIPVQLAATGRDQFNNTVNLSSVQWVLASGSAGQARLDPSGLLTPLSPGTINVQATAGALAATLPLLIASPALRTVDPFFGRVGDIITVTGSGFGTNPGSGVNVPSCTPTAGTTPSQAGPAPSATPLPAGASTVYFSDSRIPAVPANEIVCWSDGRAQVKVPDGARPGPLAVRIGSFLSNTVDFVRLFGINAP